MKHALLIQSVIEILGAMALFMSPNLFFLEEYNNTSANLIKMIAIMALCIGALSVVLWRHFEYKTQYKQAYLVFMGYQAFSSFHLYALFNIGLTNQAGPFITHVLLFVLLFIFYMRDINKKE